MITWATLFTLASLRSPLAPSYTLFALVWALSILAAEVRGRRQTAALAPAWVILATPQPGASMPALGVTGATLALAGRLNDRSIAAAPVRD